MQLLDKQDIKCSNNLFIIVSVVLVGEAINGLIFQNTPWLLLPISLLCVVDTIKCRCLFKKHIFLFLFFAFISAISCYYYRGQSILDSLRCPAFREYYILLAYFIFIKLKPSIKIVETTIIYAFLIFILLYSIEYLIFPKQLIVVIAGAETGRLRVIGQIVNSLAFFLCLNRWLLHKNPMNILLMLLSVFVFFSLGFRAMFAALLISSTIMFFKLYGFAIRKMIGIGILLLITGVILSQTAIVQNAIEEMMERQETDTYDNDNYLRVAEFAYYMDRHFESEIERLFGSGQPYPFSSYGKIMAYDINDPDAMLRSGCNDWGLIGQSWLVGPFTIIVFVIAMFKCVKVSWRSDSRFFYIAAWYIFLLIISFNNMEVHRQGSMIYHALMFYVVSLLNERLKSNQSSSSKYA